MRFLPVIGVFGLLLLLLVILPELTGTELIRTPNATEALLNFSITDEHRLSVSKREVTLGLNDSYINLTIIEPRDALEETAAFNNELTNYNNYLVIEDSYSIDDIDGKILFKEADYAEVVVANGIVISAHNSDQNILKAAVYWYVITYLED